MAENNQIIGATIQVDTGNSGANVSALNKETSNLKNSLEGIGATAKGTGKDIGATGAHFGKLKDSMSSIPGPANQLTHGIGGVNQAFNMLRANPIIGIFALIAGLVIALFQRFQKMEGVSDSLGKAWASLSMIFNVFLNKILTPLIEGFTKLVDVVVGAVSWIADLFSPGLAEAAERAGELEEALDDLNDAEAESAISRAESNRKLQEARDLAEDANIPIQARIKYLKEAARIEKEETEKSIQIAQERARIMLETVAMELGARKELIMAIQIGSMEQLKAARNEIYAMENVDKEKLKVIDDLIISSENQGASIARINKRTQEQITSLENEEEGKRKEARDKAIADQKQSAQKLAEFRNKLRQLQQDNELAAIEDSYQRELRALEIKLENGKRLNEEAYRQGNLSRAQANQLNDELQKQYDLKLAESTEKHNEEILKKETDFQEKLAKLKQDIMLGGIVNQRDLEREQLKVSREEAIKEAEKQYAEDAAKLAEIKFLIDEKFRQDQKKQQDAFDEEDRKAKLEKDQALLEKNIQKEDEVFQDPESELELKQLALEAEQKLIDDALANKIISEEIYTEKMNALSDKRKQVAELETEHKKKQTQEVADTLSALADLVGKQTIAGKALGIATALINTYQGASEAIKQKSTLPSPFDVIAKVVNVATVIATGIKTVKAITAVQVPGGGGGGGVSIPSISPSAPIAPTQVGTKLDADSINNIGNAAAGGVNRNIRAYVVHSDVQNESERNSRLERAATLGG